VDCGQIKIFGYNIPVTNRILFLKLTDLLLFGLRVKTEAGVDVLEEQDDLVFTSPREYIWIFILNLKLGIDPDPKTQRSIVRSVFYIWHMAFLLKRFFKERENRQKKFSVKDIFFRKLFWRMSVKDLGDVPRDTMTDIFRLYQNFNKEIEISSLDIKDKKYIFSFRDGIVHKKFPVFKKFMECDFDKLDFKELLLWYEKTYLVLSDLLAVIYLLMVGIKQDDPRWDDTLIFLRKFGMVGIMHDDISDIKGDIDAFGRLNEPNAFACFLSKSDKKSIGFLHQGRYEYTSMFEAKNSYPHAFKKYHGFLKEILKSLILVPGVNLHEFLEIYLFYFPEHYLLPHAPDSRIKKELIREVLNPISFEKENYALLVKYRKFISGGVVTDRKRIKKMYQDLLAILYCRELFQSGSSLTFISTQLNKPVSTILRWIKSNQLPNSLKILNCFDDYKKHPQFYYLLGVFLFSGSVYRDHIRIAGKNYIFLKKINRILSKSRNLIKASKKGAYLRFYDAALSKQLLSFISDPQKMCEEASVMQKNELLSGIIDVKGKEQNEKILVKIPAKKVRKMLSWLTELFSDYGRKAEINKKGSNYLFCINEKLKEKNPLVEMQDISVFQKKARSIILKYFGLQKEGFWEDFPGLFFVFWKEYDGKYAKNNDKRCRYFKFEVLGYFQKYFASLGKTGNEIYDTDLIDDFFVEEDSLEKNLESAGEEKIKSILAKLKARDLRTYTVIALRFGFLDGKEHTLTNDLSLRLYDLGIKNNKGQILSKSQTYQLLQNSLSNLRKQMD
jgi:hypothetical protein